MSVLLHVCVLKDTVPLMEGTHHDVVEAAVSTANRDCITSYINITHTTVLSYTHVSTATAVKLTGSTAMSEMLHPLFCQSDTFCGRPLQVIQTGRRDPSAALK